MLGVLELAGKGSGFLRRREAGYLPSNGDVHVGERLIRQLGLRPGDEIDGSVRTGGKGRGPSLETVTSILGRAPDTLGERLDFNRLAAIHPNEQLRLEADGAAGGQADYTNRVIDLLCPLGKGQRALIVAPAKAGKTMVLQSIAQGVSVNYPGADLFILLVDERPEEVFEMEAAGVGEVIASSFDNPAQRHVALAELTLERARRRVELGDDVVLIVDSLTRLARAYNTVEKGTGRTLSGGLDAQSLEKPKRFLGQRPADRPGPGRRLPDHHRHCAGGHRQPDGPGDLRGVQGDRQQRTGAEPGTGRAAGLPGHRPGGERHQAGGTPADPRGAGGLAASSVSALPGMTPINAMTTCSPISAATRPMPS